MSRMLFEYWRDISDDSWPMLEYWDDFVNADDRIQNECWQQHALASRLAEIDNQEYWHCKSIYPMYQHENFVFVNVPKCGLIHYEDFFLRRLQWKPFYPEKYQDLGGLYLFGLLMDPYRRYIKGLTEFLWKNNLHQQIDLENVFYRLLFPDAHCYPVSLLLGRLFSTINWIPLGIMTDPDIKRSMNNFFAKHNSAIQIPIDHPKMHQSSHQKLQLYQQIKHAFFHHSLDIQARSDSLPSHFIGLHSTLIPENIFYRQLITNFNSNWHHTT